MEEILDVELWVEECPQGMDYTFHGKIAIMQLYMRPYGKLIIIFFLYKCKL